jgi:hypothetical protein
MMLAFPLKAISEDVVHRKLTELVISDGFDRHNLRRYRLGIDAK